VPRSRKSAKQRSACCNSDGGNSCKLTHRCRLTGGGIKPPEGAVVKSHGAERSGKGVTRLHHGMDIGVERKLTAD